MEVIKTCKDGSTYAYREGFDPTKYDFASDLRAMDPIVRARYIANSKFEVIVNETSLQSGDATVLNQLGHLAPILQLIENLVIKVEVPPTGPWLTSFVQYNNSTVRKCLLKVIERIRLFAGLKKMAVILALPKGLETCSHEYVLPFYELDTFTRWSVGRQKYGKANWEPFGVGEISEIDHRYAKLCENRRVEQEAKDKVENAVFTRHSTFKKGSDWEGTRGKPSKK
ncbi:hypothetical protein EG329_004299 [Mollisiaceae sp. DMI_Dod_QoI]|nr:hypothetical protein EG329_004299 [Helotiales sp. DMI_Dod_QoI]